MNFNQSQLNQSQVDRKQKLKLFTASITLRSEWPVKLLKLPW